MKNILGLVLVCVLLWSCGSQFNRSKYDRHMWNRSHGKSEKELQSTSEEAKTEVKTVIPSTNQTDAKVTEEIPTTVTETTLKEIVENKNTEQETELSKGNKNTTTQKDSFQKIRKISKLNPIANAKRGALKKLTGNSDSDLVNILMIVLLVILVILAFTLLNTLLGGALGWILGVVLLVILIYFILRLLGVV